MSSTECPPITTALEAELDAALHETLDENDALKAELAALQAENRRLLDWITGEGPDALATLQRIYSNPNTPEPHQIKAANSALPFERAKPASSVAIGFKLFDYLEEARQRRPLVELKAVEPPKPDPAA